MSSNPYAKRSQMAPAARAVRAYAAPVNRLTGLFAAFDPASQGQFDLDSPPSPFIDLGWVENFQRTAITKYEALRTGPGANITVQYRTQPEARLEFDLPSWGKLQLALSGGTQQMNVLAEIPTTIPEPSGGDPLPASPVQAGSTQTELVLTSDQLGNFTVGDVVAVDADYTGATGYLGSGAPGTYLSAPVTTGSVIDLRAPHYLQRLARRQQDPNFVASGGAASGAADNRHGRAESRRVRGSRRQQLFPGVVGTFYCRA